MGEWLQRAADVYVWGKQWSVYPFIPPLFSLLLSLVIIPRYDWLLNGSLLSLLRESKREDDYEMVETLIRARTLQLAYITEVPVFVVSVTSAAQGNYPNLLVGLTIVGLLLLILIFPKVFLTPADYLASTEFPEMPKKGRLTVFARRGWKQHDFYSALLALLNIFFIVIIVVTLPEKKAP